MQQKKGQVCVHEGCSHNPFIPVGANIDDDKISRHSKHSRLEWEKVVAAAKKCTTPSKLEIHFKELIERVQKMKENLDVILSMHIQKLSNSNFKPQLSPSNIETLDKILIQDKNQQLKGGELHNFINAVNKKKVVSEFGVHIDQQQILNLFTAIETSFVTFKESNKQLAKNCMLQGWENWTSGEGKTAIEYYSRALQLYPEHCQSYFQRGFAYHSMGQDILAQNDYNNCLRICPQHSSSLTNRGYIESQRGNKIKALEWYTKALQANPNDTVSYNNRAYIYFALYKYTDALKDVNRSIQLKQSKQSYKFRSEIYSKLGRRKDAARDLETARKL